MCRMRHPPRKQMKQAPRRRPDLKGLRARNPRPVPQARIRRAENLALPQMRPGRPRRMIASSWILRGLANQTNRRVAQKRFLSGRRRPPVPLLIRRIRANRWLSRKVLSRKLSHPRKLLKRNRRPLPRNPKQGWSLPRQRRIRPRCPYLNRAPRQCCTVR